jgi:hypothetical protein
LTISTGSVDLALRALLVGLAAWRVGVLLIEEEGPFEIFARLRNLIAPDEVEYGTLRFQLVKLISCIFCLSPWLAAGGWLLWEASPVPVAIAAAAAIVVLVEGRGREVRL